MSEPALAWTETTREGLYHERRAISTIIGETTHGFLALSTLTTIPCLRLPPCSRVGHLTAKQGGWRLEIGRVFNRDARSVQTIATRMLSPPVCDRGPHHTGDDIAKLSLLTGTPAAAAMIAAHVPMSWVTRGLADWQHDWVYFFCFHRKHCCRDLFLHYFGVANARKGG